MSSGARRLLIRIVGAPILLAALLFVVYLDYRADQVVAIRFLIAGACAIGLIEFLRLVRSKGIEVAGGPAVLLILLPALPWSWILNRPVPPLYLPAAGFFFVGLLLQLAWGYPRLRPEGAGLTALGFAYVSLLQLALLLPRPLTAGSYLPYLLFIVAAAKGADIAGFVFGKAFGRHRLAPLLSPGKTWEGAAGATLAGGGVAYAILRLSPIHADLARLPDWSLPCLAVSVTIASQVGDLVESVFKRWAEAKDSGRLIPEFGGVLDMTDGLLLAVPVAFVGFEVLARMFA